MISTQTKVKSALDKDFIKTDDMAEMLGLAFQHNKNCMIYGPPGYGKVRNGDVCYPQFRVGRAVFRQDVEC